MRKWWYIGVVLLMAISFAGAPQRAVAQMRDQGRIRAQQPGENSGLYGNNNPYATDEEDEEGQEPTDTTKRRWPRKPLESYFFSDSIRSLNNFLWTVKRDYNEVEIEPLDTTLADWRIDYPIYRKGVGDITLGGLGQSSIPYDYFERPTSKEVTFANSYEGYTYDMENVPFYNVKKPFMHMTYLESGQKRYREEHFELTLAQNVSPSTGFNINYKARGTKGQYDWSRTKNHNLEVAFSHTGKRYSVHAAYYHNQIVQRENGGVVGEWAIVDTTYEMPSGVPMVLSSSEAQNTYRNNGFFVIQSYGIPLLPVTQSDFSIGHLPAIFLGHSIDYSVWSKTYTDKYGTYTNERDHRGENGQFVSKTFSYYENWYINPDRSRDSLYERRLSNRLFLQAQPWNRNGVVGTLTGGVGLDLHAYSQFALDSYLKGGYKTTKKSSFYAYGSINGKIRRYVDWGGDFKFYPSGYRGGDFSVGAHLALTAKIRRQHPVILKGSFRMESRSPGFWEENLFSNHYVWFTPLNKENDTRFEVSLQMPNQAFEVVARQGVVSDKIYYGPSAHITQAPEAVSLTSVYARKDFRIAGLHLDHRVLLQWSSNQEVVPVPLLSAYLSYYYEFWVKRDVLRMQFGADCRFNTEFYAPGYNPALGAFYNQREVEVGNYPYTDLFIMAKWKRMRIFLKYQHINFNLFGGNRYFSAAYYPLNPGMFKMGISWGFYD